MNNAKTLYENIRKRRIELNMSQQALAEAVGYSGKSMISQVENGLIDLPITMVKKFAEVLQIEPGDLMGWDDFEIVHDGNIIYNEQELKDKYREELKEELKEEIFNDLMIKISDGDENKVDFGNAETDPLKLYEMYQKSSPEIQSAVELLLKSAQQSPESPQKN